jgi:hypothetical protein
MDMQLFKWGYRRHCSYASDEGVLDCYIKFDLNENTYAFVYCGETVKTGIKGRDEANEFFKNNFAHIVDLGSKVVHERNHLYYIHYRINSRGKDMVCMRTSKMSLEEITEWWHKTYEFAISNYGYELQKIEQAY